MPAKIFDAIVASDGNHAVPFAKRDGLINCRADIDASGAAAKNTFTAGELAAHFKSAVLSDDMDGF